MLLISGSFEFDPAHRDQVVAACVAMQQATRAEPGCRAYVFSADLQEPNVIHVAEKWDSQTDLETHFATPHMKDFGAATKGTGLRGRSLLKYEVSSEGPVR